MAKIPRKQQKIFSQTSSENGQFGSAQLGTKVLSDDLDVLQTLAAWLAGWSDATVSSEKLPPLEEMNTMGYVATSQLAYLFQEGLPEYLSTTEYFINSIVKKSGTYEIYGSIIDNNTGNALPVQVDDANWQYLGDLAELVNAGAGTPVASVLWFGANTPPTGFLECDGAAISRTTFAPLFAIVGTVFGVGDGSTTFNIPDLRGEGIRGWDNGRGVDTGRVFGSAQLDAFQNFTGTFTNRQSPIVGTPTGVFSGADSGISGAVNASDGTIVTFDPSTGAGIRTATETRGRNVALLPCIKF